MHISIMNSTFPLSYDDATDASGQWTWEKLTPLCPVCLRKGIIHPLLVPGKEDTKLAPVFPHDNGDAAVECDQCLFTAMVQHS